MTLSDFSRPEPSPVNNPVTINRADFSQLYDRYAPALLGVITAIVNDETEAVRLLERTFVDVRSQFDNPRPAGQPFFVWLLSIARRTALEAVKSQKSQETPVFQLSSSGKVLMGGLAERTTATPFAEQRIPTSLPLKELLDAVLIKNCTPEEAASSVGLPVTTARQQLRLAMQQLRTSKAA